MTKSIRLYKEEFGRCFGTTMTCPENFPGTEEMIEIRLDRIGTFMNVHAKSTRKSLKRDMRSILTFDTVSKEAVSKTHDGNIVMRNERVCAANMIAAINRLNEVVTKGTIYSYPITTSPDHILAKM